MLIVTPDLVIDEDALQETFIRASGPGGQNVNKVATAVQLRLDVARAGMPEPVRARLMALAGKRVSEEGVLVIDARRFRTQEQNRQDARERLAALIRQAAEPPKHRRPTKPTRAAKARRLESKRQRSQVKRLRCASPDPN